MTWSLPLSSVDGYELEMRIETGSYENLGGLLPGNAIGAIVTLVSTLPELTTIYARVRAVKGGVYSAYSQEASYFRSLRAPTDLASTVHDYEQILVTWTQPSTGATGVQVERALYDDLTFAWGSYSVVATVAGNATSYLDASGLLPLSAYRYRLRNIATYRSSPVESATVEDAGSGGRTAVAPPIDVQASIVAGVPHLTWTNQSAVATEVRIERADGFVDANAIFTPVASLPSSAVSWSDTGTTGAFTYRVVAVWGQAPGPSSVVHIVVPPSGLAPSVLPLPPGSYAARDGSGTWWMASLSDGTSTSLTRLTLWEPVAAQWSPHNLDPAGTHFAHPGVLLDGGGYPHTVYLEDVPNGTTSFPVDIVHEWHDGSAWQREVLGRRYVDYNGAWEIWFALGLDDAPHVVWKNQSRTFPEYAHKTAAGWTFETLTSSLYDPTLAFGVAGLGSAPDGALYLLLAPWNALVLWTKPDGGAWTEEVVPTGGGASGPGQSFLLMPSPGGVSVAFTRFVQTDTYPNKVMHVAKASGSWSAATELGAYSSGASDQPWAGASIGSRVAFVVPEPVPEGLWLYAWDQASGWQTTRLRQSTQWDANWLGFDVSSKLWVLSPARLGLTPSDAATGALRDYVLYTEP